MPVLEAMACGTPVVCSNTSSLPEVAGDAALHFDPDNVESIIHALLRLLSDANLRAALRQRGFEQAAKFSWDRVAVETKAVYNVALKGKTKRRT